MHLVNKDDAANPYVVRISDNLGGRWQFGPGMQGGEAITTDHTVEPGDTVELTCVGNDAEDRELWWWLHPVGRPRCGPVFGSAVLLRWTVDPAAIGDRVYLGIGMSADAPFRHITGRQGLGYDAWIILYFRVVPNDPPRKLVRSRLGAPLRIV